MLNAFLALAGLAFVRADDNPTNQTIGGILLSVSLTRALNQLETESK